MVRRPCPLHPDALPFEITMNGRLGCAPCLADPWNLDPVPEFDGIEVDDGETRCPHCQTVVHLEPTAHGAWLAHDGAGVHRHPRDYAIPIGHEAREKRRYDRPATIGVEVPGLD